jgi:sugar phosphate permease
MEKQGNAIRAKSRVFYGWWVLLAGFCCLMIYSGCSVYSFGLYVTQLQKTFGWNRMDIMMANTISTLVLGFASLFVGKLLDRLGARKILFVGALITTMGYALISTTNELWQFYLFYAICGIGFAGTGFVPVSALTLAWFKKRRGMAIGLTGVGIGAGGSIMPLLLGGYVIPTFGWRTGFIVSAVLVSAIVLPLVLFVIKEKPADIGLQPDGATDSPAEAASKAKTAAGDGLTLKESLSTPAFWLICLTGLAFGFTSNSILQNQAAHLEDIGFPLEEAARALSATGLANTVSKFCFGYLCDYVKAKYTRALGLIFMFFGAFIMIWVNPSSSTTLIWCYAVLVGLAMGSWLPSMSMLVSTNFGLLAYGIIFSVTSLFNMLGSSVGPLVTGRIYDMQGSYQLAWIVFSVLCGVSAVISLFIFRPKNYTPADSEATHTH